MKLSGSGALGANHPAITHLGKLKRLAVVAGELVGFVTLTEDHGRFVSGDCNFPDLHIHLDERGRLNALRALLFPRVAREFVRRFKVRRVERKVASDIFT